MTPHAVRPNSFYVYVHSRYGSGEPFYVGKGAGRRAYKRDGRSGHWKRIVAKDGGHFTTFVARDLDEEFALLLECELIDRYRRFGVALCNQTDGGDGTSGCRWPPGTRRSHPTSEETKLKLSLLKKGKPGIKRSDECRKKMSLARTGKKYPNRKLVSAETRAKFSAIHKGKQYTLGHKLTEEHKAKVVATRMAWSKEKRDEVYKKVVASRRASAAKRKAEK